MSIVESGATAPQVIDAEEAARARSERINRIAKWTLPSAVMIASILAWHFYVTLNNVPHYVLPGPLLVAKSIVDDWPLLWPAMLTTSRLTILALIFAVIGGVALAVAFTQSKWTEMSFFPYAVILQVTPVVAIAPLLQIYIDSAFVAALLCAWIVAFFPILYLVLLIAGALPQRERVSINGGGAATARIGQYEKRGRCRNKKWAV